MSFGHRAVGLLFSLLVVDFDGFALECGWCLGALPGSIPGAVMHWIAPARLSASWLVPWSLARFDS